MQITDSIILNAPIENVFEIVETLRRWTSDSGGLAFDFRSEGSYSPAQSSRCWRTTAGPLAATESKIMLALTESGVRALCDKYSAITGVKFHPHLLRHTM